MTKHRNKMIAAVIILGILAGAWFMDGTSETNAPIIPPTPVLAAAEVAQLYEEVPEAAVIEDTIVPELYEEPEAVIEEVSDEPPEAIYDEPETAAVTEEEPVEPVVYEAPAPEISVEPEPEAPIVEIVEADIQIFGEAHESERAPVEPEDMVVTAEHFYVTLTVRVDSILYNMHLLHRDKHELVPADGVIFPVALVRAYEGESVHDVLQREMMYHRIHMSSRWTPMFNSAYVEAINNLYEFDVGPLSGWMYSVNGWFPNFGSSRYLLSEGDVVAWWYTVDLGRDLGVYWIQEDLPANE
ncbi:MAG: DUF4430 domain-containing protein [Defluviitaleaceae bacterium]|nr:DUF4430 domain-containing protein [Defluviitaleaceae bacterium]